MALSPKSHCKDLTLTLSTGFGTGWCDLTEFKQDLSESMVIAHSKETKTEAGRTGVSVTREVMRDSEKVKYTGSPDPLDMTWERKRTMDGEQGFGPEE